MNRFSYLKACAFCMCLFAMGCAQNGQGDAGQQPAELPVATASTGDALITKEYSASIEGVANVEIRPQVSGYLDKILVDEGAYVKAGQTLFLIESSLYREQCNTAEANLTTARIELDRKKELAKSKIVSDLQVQQAEAAFKAVQAQAASARINLNFCSVKAPVSGYISRIPYRLGSLISPSNQQPLTLLSDIHQVNAYFSISENDFRLMEKQYGAKGISPEVRLLLSDGSTYEVPGKVDAVEGQFSGTTGSITLRAKFDNPKTSLRSGNTGKIVIEQHTDGAVLVPIASTMSIQDKIFIFTIGKDGKAAQLPIQVSGKTATDYIVTEGLRAGDTYIATGFERLQPGTPVVAKKTASK